MEIIDEQLKGTDYIVKMTEPAVADYFDPVLREDGSRQDEAMRRADIAIVCKTKNKPAILIDVTMTSPVAGVESERKYDKVGCKATEKEKWKYKAYSKNFNIDDTRRAYIFFFGVETMGAIGVEAKRFCLMLAKASGGLISHKITYIYQRLSVMIQGLRGIHISSTVRRYARDTHESEEIGRSQTNSRRVGV